MKKTFKIIVIALFFIGCSNKELDRDSALDIIEKFYDYPNVEIQNLRGITSSHTLNNDYYDIRGEKFVKSQRKGKYGDEFWVIMTPKGQSLTLTGKPNYQGYEVATGILELKEITGIRFNEGKNTAYVDYEIIRTKVTPFGFAKKNNNGDIIKKSITMQLYDDGWRITDDKKKIYKENQFKGFNSEYLTELDVALKEITNESGDSFFYLKKTYTKKGKNFIVVDFVGENGSNVNPKLRTFLVDDNFGKGNDYCGPFPPTSFYKTFESLKSLIGYPNPAYLMVKDGVVKCIEVNQAN